MSWGLVKLGSVCSLVNGDRGKNYPSKDALMTEGIPFINAGNLTDLNSINFKGHNFISEERYELLSNGKIELNDILFCLRGSLGKFAIVDKSLLKGAIASSLVIIRAGKNINGDYLKNYLKSNLCFLQINKFENGAAQPNLSAKDLKDFEIPLPYPDDPEKSLKVQKRIAAILDKADGIRRKRQQAIQLADDFLRSVFLDMFGDPVTNPKGWEVKPVGEICSCIVPGRDKPKSFTGETPWVTTNDLEHLDVTSESKKFIGLSGFEISEVKAKIVPRNSVLMTCVGDLGTVSIAGNDMVINQQLHAFLPNEYIDSSFLSFALSFQKGFMMRMASSTTLPYMNKTICNSVPLINPPFEVQKIFGDIVKKNRVIKSKFNSSIQEPLFEILSQKAFKGEL